MLNEKYSTIVLDAIDELNQTLDVPVSVEQGEATPIYGQDKTLDSISLVSLIVSIEQKVEDKFNMSIILANEKAMSQRNSPFLTVGTLSAYIKTLVEGEKK
jgi:D-alanine--poly(phosphoribitol) ligase subunit 2